MTVIGKKVSLEKHSIRMVTSRLSLAISDGKPPALSMLSFNYTVGFKTMRSGKTLVNLASFSLSHAVLDITVKTLSQRL